MASKGPIVEVIDLETGNIGSVLKMLARIGADPVVVREPGALAGRHPVLLPGVGHFSKAAESLEARAMRPKLDALHQAGWPILGICLGAQLLCRDSEEGPGAGLGWIPTTVRRFPELDAEGKPVEIEFLLVQTEFERVLLPFKRNLQDLGITLNIRRVDTSQYVNRIRSRDYDMLVGGFGQSSTPGNEQIGYWHSSSADSPGSRNFIGLKDPAIDSLVEQLINADSRKKLVTHTRALDRALLWGHYVVPNWHIDTWRVAYWDHLQRPERTPLYDVGLHTWWMKPEAKEPANTAAEAAPSAAPEQ